MPFALRCKSDLIALGVCAWWFAMVGSRFVHNVRVQLFKHRVQLFLRFHRVKAPYSLCDILIPRSKTGQTVCALVVVYQRHIACSRSTIKTSKTVFSPHLSSIVYCGFYKDYVHSCILVGQWKMRGSNTQNIEPVFKQARNMVRVLE